MYDIIDGSSLDVIQCNNNVFVLDIENSSPELPLYRQVYQNGKFYDDDLYDLKTEYDILSTECHSTKNLYDVINKSLYSTKEDCTPKWYETWWFGLIAGIGGILTLGATSFAIKKCFGKPISLEAIKNTVEKMVNNAQSYQKLNVIRDSFETVTKIAHDNVGVTKGVFKDVLAELLIKYDDPLGTSLQTVSPTFAYRQEYYVNLNGSIVDDII